MRFVSCSRQFHTSPASASCIPGTGAAPPQEQIRRGPRAVLGALTVGAVEAVHR